MTRKQLAQELGISASMVTRLARRGMPTTKGVEAAEKWRKRHLETIRMKGTRIDTRPRPPAPPAATTCRQHNQATAAALLRVRDLGLVAHDAIAAGRFHVVAPMLRQALLEVPEGARDQVAMSLEVWDALTAAIPYDAGASAGGAAGEGMDLDEEVMGDFWYQIALGERADHHLAPVLEKAGTARKPGEGLT